MNVKNIRSKKALKFLGLLISAMVIASVSAATYNMFMNATVGVTATELSFVANDPDYTACVGSITDSAQKVEFSSMNGKPGVQAIYYPVNITNAATANHTIELVVDTFTGYGEADLYNITVTMFNGTTQQGDSIVLRPTAEGSSVTTSTTVSILTSETWVVEWTVYWKGSAIVGTDSVDVKLLLVVSS